jgi:hypothetical protein
MVAPAIIAGLGAFGGVAIGALIDALGKSKPRKKYGVVFLVGRSVAGRVFFDYDKAVEYQDSLARNGRGSIIVEKDEEGYYQGLRAVRAVAPGGKQVSLESVCRHCGGKVDDTGIGYSQFDTTEEALKITQVTTRFPTPKWAKRARFGPYPETDPGREDYLPPIEPLFRQTTSSHEWKSDVKTEPIPDKFFPGRHGMPSQPDILVVEQALQYPENPGPSAAKDTESEGTKSTQDENSQKHDASEEFVKHGKEQ